MGDARKCFDSDEIRKAVSVLKAPGEIFEIRIIKGNTVLSGYFDNADRLIQELSQCDLQHANVYISLQKVHEGCSARMQWNSFLNSGREKLPTTSDNDIVAYEWLPIDLDPVRPAGISSNDKELKAAEDMMNEIIEYMELMGFSDPVRAFSGNGYHLLYPIDEDKKNGMGIVSEVLERLDSIFSNDYCHIDVTNKNPGRIFKLYGTLAQKGRNTEDRPHRMSKIL